MTQYFAGSMTPETNAETLGAMVKVALVESAHALNTLKAIAEALYADDIDKAKLVVGNYFSAGDSPGNRNTLSDLQSALYDALPRGGQLWMNDVPKPLDARPPAARHIECINGQQFRFTRWGSKRWVVHTRCDCVLGPHWHETPHAGDNLTMLRATIRDALAGRRGDV